ncbi:hypothetical protein [Roseibium aestuarii]|uniref:ABC transporter permease n=1 Tax=Roseibium aestuarii TaxID=2600299 RepID=A0ABW4JVX2_9HYPH|nr:hypothetical protein [Roseibium aestuarii]
MFKRIFLASFYLVFRNLDAVFRVCGAWFALQFVFMLMFVLSLQGLEPDQGHTANPLLSLVFMVLTLISSASISVAWHRFALLGEVPGLIHLKLGRIELKFMGKMLLIGLIAVGFLLPAITIFVLLSSSMESFYVTIPLLLAASFILSTLLMRFNIILPATAVEQPLGLGEAFAMAKGLGCRMALALIALTLPIALIGAGIEIIAALGSGGVIGLGMQIKSLILNLLLQVITTVLGISVITNGYRIALERQSGAGAGA